MKKITLSAEARARLARQIAESTGLAVNCGGQVAALPVDCRDRFEIAG